MKSKTLILLSGLLLAIFSFAPVDADGGEPELWVWGSNASGQLGDDTGDNRDSPVKIPLPEGTEGGHWSAIAAGSSHSMAILSGAASGYWDR